MTLPDAHPAPAPLSRRDAEFLLMVFRGFRAIAVAEERSFETPASAAPPAPQSLPDRR